MTNKVNPEHYKCNNKELFNVLEDMFSKDEFTGALKFNIIKYLHRFQQKNGVEDLEKAKKYIEKLIEINLKDES